MTDAAVFSDQERADIRRFCGYPSFGDGGHGFQGWRFYQAYGLLEFRLNHLTSAEAEVIRRYLSTIAQLEAPVSAGSRNADELRDRTRLFDDWRRRMCGFLGVPPGQGFSDASAIRKGDAP